MDRADPRFLRAPVANRRLVGFDDEADVVPAFDEVAERARAQEHVDEAEIAVFVDVDQPPPQRLVVPLERVLGGSELGLIPGELALHPTQLAAELREVRVDDGDVAVGVVELGLNRADAFAGVVQFRALLREPRGDGRGFGLLRADARFDLRGSEAGKAGSAEKRHGQGERCNARTGAPQADHEEFGTAELRHADSVRPKARPRSCRPRHRPRGIRARASLR